MSTMAAATK